MNMSENNKFCIVINANQEILFIMMEKCAQYKKAPDQLGAFIQLNDSALFPLPPY